MGRIMTVWMLGSGVPMLGIVLAAVFALSLRTSSSAAKSATSRCCSSTSPAPPSWWPAGRRWRSSNYSTGSSGVIVEEVDRHSGLVNKFEGDATLAVFGAPVRLDRPEDEALAAARTIARRLRDEVPECPAGLGVAAGSVVAGNVGAAERFEYTVIGIPCTRRPGSANWPSRHPNGCWRPRPPLRPQAKANALIGNWTTRWCCAGATTRPDSRSRPTARPTGHPGHEPTVMSDFRQ